MYFDFFFFFLFSPEKNSLLKQFYFQAFFHLLEWWVEKFHTELDLLRATSPGKQETNIQVIQTAGENMKWKGHWAKATVVVLV